MIVGVGPRALSHILSIRVPYERVMYETLLTPEYSIDDFFVTRLVDPNDNNSFIETSKVWTGYGGKMDDGVYTKPDGYYSAITYSRHAFRCPHVVFGPSQYDWPDLGSGYTSHFYMGLENGGGAGTSLVALTISKEDTVWKNYVVVGSGQYDWVFLDIAPWANLNPSTGNVNNVVIKAFKGFFVISAGVWPNSYPVAFVVDGTNSNVNAWVDGPPYAVIAYKAHLSRYVGIIHAIEGNYTPELSVRSRIPRLRINSDECSAPFTVPLYITGTTNRLVGSSVSTSGVTSHPFPIAADRATLFFQADQSGTLYIDIFSYDSNWYQADSVSVSANTLVKYNFNYIGRIARIRYVPSASATVSVAEVVLM